MIDNLMPVQAAKKPQSNMYKVAALTPILSYPRAQLPKETKSQVPISMIRRFCDFNTIHENITTCIGWLRGVIKPLGLIGRGVGLVAPDGARSKFSRFPCEVTLAMLNSCMIITLLR
jgi:hypothetical protein